MKPVDLDQLPNICWSSTFSDIYSGDIIVYIGHLRSNIFNRLIRIKTNIAPVRIHINDDDHDLYQ